MTPEHLQAAALLLAPLGLLGALVLLWDKEKRKHDR